MRVLTETTAMEWARVHARAQSSLQQWVRIVRSARWQSFGELRETFRSADMVHVDSGRTVVVFNIGGNNYRLICGVHYNTGMVFTLRFLTPAEYSKGFWKTEL